MKKLLLGLAICIPFQLIAADDSVYSWGDWAQGIKPAAGPAITITPAPVDQPSVNFRPNENSAFTRQVRAVNTPAANVQLPQAAGPAMPGAPQVSNVVILPPGTQTANPAGLASGSQL